MTARSGDKQYDNFSIKCAIIKNNTLSLLSV